MESLLLIGKKRDGMFPLPAGGVLDRNGSAGMKEDGGVKDEDAWSHDSMIISWIISKRQ